MKPRLALLFVLAIAAGTLLFMAGGGAPLAPDAALGETDPASGAGPEADTLAAIAPLEVEEAAARLDAAGPAGGPVPATVEVLVVESGAPVSDVTVEAHDGPHWFPVRTDREGIARFALSPGRWDLRVAQGRTDTRQLVLPAPEGASSQWIDVRAGDTLRVELELYRGAQLEVEIVGSEGASPVCRIEHRTANEMGTLHWAPVSLQDSERQGLVIAGPLAPGKYRVRAPKFRQLTFAPVTVELVLGQTESLRIVAERRPRVRIPVVLGSSGDGEAPPLRFQYVIAARTDDGEVDMGAPETLPLGGGVRRTGGVTGADGWIEERLDPGRYDIQVSLQRVAPPQIQLVAAVPGRTWRFAVDVDEGGVATPRTLEIDLEVPASLAILDIEVPGARPGHLEGLGVRLRAADGEDLRFPLWLGRSGRDARLVVDPSLLARDEVRVVRGEGPQEHLVETRRLAAGAGTWSVVRNW